MPFDKLKAPGKAEGLRVDTERHFFAPILESVCGAVERINSLFHKKGADSNRKKLRINFPKN
jgi:hypothetical protein